MEGLNRRNFLKKTFRGLSIPAIAPLTISSKADIKNPEIQTEKKKAKYKEAYLKVDDLGEGMFSRERILHARDYNGTDMSGFFDNCNIKNGRLKVTVIREKKDLVAVVTPQYFMEMSNIIHVKKSDLEYVA